MKTELNLILSQLSKLGTKIESVDDKLDSVDKTLVKQEENLKEHMRRTDLLEKQHKELDNHVRQEIEPVKKHINQVTGVFKFISIAVPIILTIAGIIYKYSI